MTMTVMTAVLWAAVLGNLLLVLRLAGRLRFLLDPLRNPPPIPAPAVGEPAPPFSANTLDGRPLTLAQYADRSLTLLYLSYNCPSCRTFLPTLGDLRRSARDRGGELVLVVFDEDSTARAATDRLIEQYGLNGPVVLITSGHPLQRAYNPRMASPFFIHVERGITRSTGGVGLADWLTLVRGWQSPAASATSGARR